MLGCYADTEFELDLTKQILELYTLNVGVRFAFELPAVRRFVIVHFIVYLYLYFNVYTTKGKHYASLQFSGLWETLGRKDVNC